VKTALRAMYLSCLLDRRVISLKDMLFEAARRVRFRKRTVSVFLQLDDPYSYLLAHYLKQVIKSYPKVDFNIFLCQALRGDFMPEPAQLAEYALSDCTLLAREFGIPFLDRGDTPVVEFRRPLLEFLAAEQDEDDFVDTFIGVITDYWRGDTEAVTRVVGRTHSESAETNVLVGRNQLKLRKMGHYNCATMHYQGDWYWGVDRLKFLLDKLDAKDQNRFDEPLASLASLDQAMQLSLPVTVPSKAEALPVLELFHSFRSPYSYLALRKAFDIADAFGLDLDVKPVLPMVDRGLKVPKTKLLYTIKDANRLAMRDGVPFGRLADSAGLAAERCVAGFYYAKSQNRDRDFLLEAGKAIFSESIDVATDAGMQIVAERAGLFWPELRAAMQDQSWRERASSNRVQLSDAGHWGVPTLKIGGQIFWGQDRDWLVARMIEDLCHDGEGIIV